MKTFVPVSVTVTSSRTIREPGAVRYRLASKRSRLWRFRHFIETTDWDEKVLCHKAIDTISLVVIVISLLYFMPVLGSMVLR